ncbi:MAG: hypothetical protein GEU88_05295 [Solirubrobacterales bacterium]|nr:hypothetical protein [Solirubrobacterales bacterium]
MRRSRSATVARHARSSAQRASARRRRPSAARRRRRSDPGARSWIASQRPRWAAARRRQARRRQARRRQAMGRHEIGFGASSIAVEVREGTPSFAVAGTPDAAVRELRERVRAAIANAGFEFPFAPISVAIRPAGPRRVPGELEVAIAVALLIASGQVDPGAVAGRSLRGELRLDGSVAAAPTLRNLAELHPGR